MDKDFLGKAITLDNQEKWYICDKTEQNGDTYYLAVKLDKDYDPDDESKIFKEVVDGDRVYLDDEIEPEIFNYLSAIFVTNFTNNSEKIIEELNREEEAE